MGVRASKYSKIIETAPTVKRLGAGGPPPKGYVPISVGTDKRFMVHTKAFGDSDLLEFLGRSAEEYGFSNQGVLQISYDQARAFEEWATKGRARRNMLLRVIQS